MLYLVKYCHRSINARIAAMFCYTLCDITNFVKELFREMSKPFFAFFYFHEM